MLQTEKYSLWFKFPSNNLMACQTTAYFPCSPDTPGIMGGNSTKTRLALSSSSFSDWCVGEAGPWCIPNLGKLLWPLCNVGRKPELAHRWIGNMAAFCDLGDLGWPTPFGHLFTHTHVAPVGRIGLPPLKAVGCLCFASSPCFYPGSWGVPQSLTPASCLYRQLKGLHSWGTSWKPDVLLLWKWACICVYVYVQPLEWNSKRSAAVGQAMCEPEPPGPDWCTGQPRQGGGRGKLQTLLWTFIMIVLFLPI